MNQLKLQFPQKKKNTKIYSVYVGRSNIQGEYCAFTIGITRNLDNRVVTKGFTPIHTFTHRMTRADAQSIEGHAHTIADRHFDRAYVKHGWEDRQGKRPNRTKDWWYCKPSKKFIAMMIRAINDGYIKRLCQQIELPF